MAIVRRQRRKKNRKRIPDIGAGIKRSTIHERKRSSQIKHDSDLQEMETVLGSAAVVFKGPYEVLFEVMAPVASTGTIVNDTGTLTILSRTGTLYLRLMTVDGEQKTTITSPGDLLRLDGVDENTLDLIAEKCGFNVEENHAYIAEELQEVAKFINFATVRDLRSTGISEEALNSIIKFLKTSAPKFKEKLYQLRVGATITIHPGQQYSLSTGESSVDFLRIQTAGYFESVKQLSALVPPEERKYQAHTVPQKSVADDNTLAQGPRRKSYDKKYRSKIAELRKADRVNIENKKGITRKVRPSKRADEVIQDGGTYRRGPTVVRGVNPRPVIPIN